MECCPKSVIRVFGFHNHTRVAKRRMLSILNAKRKKQRKAANLDLLKTTRKMVGYARRAIESINSRTTSDPSAMALFCQIDHYVQLALKVIDQTERRVMHGEKVDATDKGHDWGRVFIY